jgi:hypothetical protein
MIKFFRKIRQRLLAENKVSKYILYAIGEIVLVVIGIVIALQINNQNQERIKQERVDEIIVNIQADISLDIGYSNWLIGRYIRQNDMKDLVFSNQFDYDTLTQSNISEIYVLTRAWANLPTQVSGYNQLMNNLEEVPEDYQELVRGLNWTYRSLKDMVELYSDQHQQLTLSYKLYLINNQPWYSEDEFNNEISPAQIDYYKNDPKFKSRVMESMEALSSLMWAHSRYRAQITDAYVQINDLLGDKANPLPSKIRNTTLMTEDDAQKYVGIYDESVDAPNGQIIEITAEGKDLFISTERGKKRLLNYHTEKSWFGALKSNDLILFDEENNNTFRLIDDLTKAAIYKKRGSQ